MHVQCAIVCEAAIRSRMTSFSDKFVGPGYNDESLVFAGAEGCVINPHTFGDVFREPVRSAGVPRILLHDLRHTHVTLLLKSDVHLKVTSALLGHATTGITGDLYSYATEGTDEGAAGLYSLLARAGADTTKAAC